MTWLEEACLRVQQTLALEEQRGAFTTLAECTSRQEQRARIDHELVRIEQEVGQYRRRFERLPALPDASCMQWARQVLTFPKSRLLVVDTTYPGESASVVQVLALDLHGAVRFRQCAATVARLSETEQAHLGLTPQDLGEARPLPKIWPDLLAALHGCYLLVWESLALNNNSQTLVLYLSLTLYIFREKNQA
jgi:hypothetical protein